MLIKQYRTVQQRVNDPFRPGKKTFEDRMLPTGAHEISHEGNIYTADAGGWFEVSFDAGNALMGFRSPGGVSFFNPDQVLEQVSLGALDDSESVPNTSKHQPVKTGLGKRGKVARV